MPDLFPCEEMYTNENTYYELEEQNYLSEMKNRLIIDWGKSTLLWYQKGTNIKPILSIQTEAKYEFKGYKKEILSFDKLKDIVENPDLYENYYTALSSVKAVYLIVDKTDGKQYVGSAYGNGGLLERWTCYVNTHHGGNKKLINLLKIYPNRYTNFEFTILQIFSLSSTADEVIAVESLYKRKLKSIEFGLNDN